MANKESRFFADTTRHLARKLNHQVSRVRDPSNYPADVLDSDQIDIQFLQHIGFPEFADGVAYEPVQKLLAVSLDHYLYLPSFQFSKIKPPPPPFKRHN
jgi:hypothetical protein